MTVTQMPAKAGQVLKSLSESRTAFLQAYPEYQSTFLLEELRKTEYARLDRLGHVYLDYTGGGVYGESQVKEHMNLLMNNVFGNPHSSNPTSLAMTNLVESARAYVLEFFNASPEEYDCIFTSNASGALKLVGESYPFTSDSRYLLTYDNHNSVNGIREFARSRGAKITYLSVDAKEMRVSEDELDANLDQPGAGHNLFAYPGQSNFSGVQHSLAWIERAHQKGWDVLLDAAAFVPTNRLDLSVVKPDFVSMSFYKIFGYPTGVGALILRHEALAKLRRPWFAGGTITVASVQGDRYYLHQGAEGFEDGTVNYLNLPAVEIGLRYIARIGYEMIHTHVVSLTGWLLGELSSLCHGNGAPVLKIYGPLTTEERGGTIAMNFFDPHGHFIDHFRVEDRANQEKISLRTGCFCNPGDGEVALDLSADMLTSCFIRRENLEYEDFRNCFGDQSTGAVRVSVGLATTFEDAWRLVSFARGFIDKNYTEI